MRELTQNELQSIAGGMSNFELAFWAAIAITSTCAGL